MCRKYKQLFFSFNRKAEKEVREERGLMIAMTMMSLRSRQDISNG